MIKNDSYLKSASKETERQAQLTDKKIKRICIII